MHKIIRTAFDYGVTFFDTEEAYGPFECERILEESIAPFRNDAVITSKFGWNIDQQTGQRLPELNSRPDHIKLVVEGMLKRLRTASASFRESPWSGITCRKSVSKAIPTFLFLI